MICVATLLGLVQLWLHRDVVYCAVLIWAFAAIVDKQHASATVKTTALVDIAILAIGIAAAVADLIRKRRLEKLTR